MPFLLFPFSFSSSNLSVTLVDSEWTHMMHQLCHFIHLYHPFLLFLFITHTHTHSNVTVCLCHPIHQLSFLSYILIYFSLSLSLLQYECICDTDSLVTCIINVLREGESEFFLCTCLSIYVSVSLCVLLLSYVLVDFYSYIHIE